MSPEHLTLPTATSSEAGAPAAAAPASTRPAFRPVALPSVHGTAGAAGTAEHERARAAGYAAGWAAGARAAAEAAAAQARAQEEAFARSEAARRAALDDALAVLERAVVAAAGRTVPVVDEVRHQVLEAGLALAEAVLGRELVPGPASARALLDRALALPADVGPQTVRLHPADLAAVEALVAETARVLPEGVRLVADPGLAPGDAVSEHAAGFLDAQVGTALARARAALLEEDA